MISGGINFNYFPKINWPNWQISRCLNVCLCFVWRIGGWATSPLYATGKLALSVCRATIVLVDFIDDMTHYHNKHLLVSYPQFQCTFQVKQVGIFLQPSQLRSCHTQHSGCFLPSRRDQHADVDVCQMSSDEDCRYLQSTVTHRTI